MLRIKGFTVTVSNRTIKTAYSLSRLIELRDRLPSYRNICNIAHRIQDIRVFDLSRQRVKEIRYNLINSIDNHYHTFNVTLSNGNKVMKFETRFCDFKDNVKYHVNQALDGIREKRAESKRLYGVKEVYYKREYYHELKKCRGVYMQTGTILTIQELTKTKRIFKQKSPNDSTLKHVGIEWEFACKISQSELGALLYSKGFADIVTVKSDGSVNTREGYPHAVEVTALIPETNLVDVVTRLLAILAPLGEVNKVNAGMHVHLDARETVGRTGQDMFNKLVAVQKQLYAIVPSFRRSNQYCKKLTGSKKDWYRHIGRYHGINKNAYDKYRTIELRLHQATLDAPKVLHFVNLLIGIVEHSEVLQVTTVRRMVMALPLSADTRTAIIEREKKYKKTVTDSNEAQAA
jgi:hypothetical protein